MAKESIQKLLDLKMQNQHFKKASVGFIDFKKKEFDLWHYQANESTLYDLASLTKPLTLASSFHLHPELLKKEKFIWLLNHRAGLPIGGRLSKDSWREQVLSYSISRQENDTYSDFSALRLQLELEKFMNKGLYELVKSCWDSELCHWMDIKNPFDCPVTGIRKGSLIQGEVHDDNAFVLKEKLSHAGLFSTLNGLCQSLLNLFQNKNSFDQISDGFSELQKGQRFVLGWDRVENLKETLAGGGCSHQTFGHLGFTGTSIWIDLTTQKGWVLLTNATENYWYERSGLADLRKSLGQALWKL